MPNRLTLLAWALAACVALPLARGLYEVPVQVSDSLEPIVIAATYPSMPQLLADAPRFSPTTFRPLRYIQARLMVALTEATDLSFRAVFRGTHVLLFLALVGLFVMAARVRTGVDLAAFAIALPVFFGIHTFVAMLQEAYPVNHFAEVGVCSLAVLVLATRPPRWYVAPLVCLLLATAVSVVESGVLVWVVVVACALAGLRGADRATVVSSTILTIAFLGLRHWLGISSPGVGGNGSGYWADFYSADELATRFGAHPLPFMVYNVVGGALSLLASEPRTGVYSLAVAARTGDTHPVLLINLASSLATTTLIAWSGNRRRRIPRAAWTDADRIYVASLLVMGVNAALTLPYMKDEIISDAGLFYAVAGFVAVRELLDTLPLRSMLSTVAIALLLTVVTGLWTFRAAGVHYILRYDAFKTRNEWVGVLKADRSNWPENPRALAITRRLRDEAILGRGVSPTFLPRWADRYWVE
jgi:hypothetical protein